MYVCISLHTHFECTCTIMYTHFSVSELVDAVPLVPVPTAALPVFIPPPITFQRNPREKDDILLDTVLLLCNFKMKKKKQ